MHPQIERRMKLHFIRLFCSIYEKLANEAENSFDKSVTKFKSE